MLEITSLEWFLGQRNALSVVSCLSVCGWQDTGEQRAQYER